MYEKTLKTRLREIFGVKDVVFDSFKLGKDQEVLWCNVYDNDIRLGDQAKEKALVSGTLGIAADKGKLLRGWMHKQYKKEANRDFWLSPHEQTIPYEYNGRAYTKYSVEFRYWYNSEYNPPIGEMAAVEIEVTAK